MLREQEIAPALDTNAAWSELEGDDLPGGSRPKVSLPLQLPIWTDLVSSTAKQDTQPDIEAPLALPRSIEWARMPESMTVKQIRLRCLQVSAADILQGMACQLMVQVCRPLSDAQDTSVLQEGQNAQDGSSHMLSASDWNIDTADNMLTAQLQLDVQFEDRMVISTIGEQYGPGDAIYLASWGSGTASQADPVDDSLILSYCGSASNASCIVELLLASASPGKLLRSFKHRKRLILLMQSLCAMMLYVLAVTLAAHSMLMPCACQLVVPSIVWHCGKGQLSEVCCEWCNVSCCMDP